MRRVKKFLRKLLIGFDGKSRILFQADLPPVGAAVYSIRQSKSKIKDTELVVSKRLFRKQ